ncbi:MAG: hypothetical protein IPL78_27990 [Chloroflexi bacterium]|nr:hypothetical protein [Chloroflexota bacterium]
MFIQLTPPERFAALAETIAAQNSQPETQCIHSGDQAKAIAAEMHHFHDEGRFVMWQAEQQNELVGLLGGELDEEMAFLWGPFVLAGEWMALRPPSGNNGNLLSPLPLPNKPPFYT